MMPDGWWEQVLRQREIDRVLYGYEVERQP